MTNVKKILLISWIVVICGITLMGGSGEILVAGDRVSTKCQIPISNESDMATVGLHCRLEFTNHPLIDLASSSQNPASSSQNPASSSQNPATSNLNPVSSIESPAASNQHPGSSIQDPVVPGAERLDLYLKLLQGKSVGLTINHSSLVQGRHLVDVLLENNININRIYSPEHGFRGTADAGAKIDDQMDSQTGLSIVSLYGKNRKPQPITLNGVDIMIFDIQDVGVRFYTFISTMHLVMEACAEAGIPVVVLDRPNPNGYYVDGPMPEPEYRSFVGMHEIPVVYGLTVGELATMINGERWLENGVQCDLTVIPCENYDHTMTYDLPVAPSPNLPNLRSILLYPSLCFFEGTNVSVGRGTDNQFQVIGHPDYTLGSYAYTPEPKPGAMSPKYDGVTLFGTNLASLSKDEILEWRSINLSWLIQYYTYLSHSGDFFLENLFFDKLAGTARLREQILAGWSVEEIRASWVQGLEEFGVKRRKYLLYPDFK